jgi:hypothetical protein
MKLNPDFKAKWVAALRSGDYAQAREQLIADYEMPDGRQALCCLGVGCVVSGIPALNLYGYALPALLHVRSWWQEYDDGDEDESARDPIVMVNGDYYTLADLNDRLRLTFEEIADIIEQQL